MAAVGDCSGALVVRAWIEGDPPQLKARIMHTVHLAPSGPTSATASSAEQIQAEVRRWLDALEERASPVTGP